MQQKNNKKSQKQTAWNWVSTDTLPTRKNSRIEIKRRCEIQPEIVFFMYRWQKFFFFTLERMLCQVRSQKLSLTLFLTSSESSFQIFVIEGTRKVSCNAASLWNIYLHFTFLLNGLKKLFLGNFANSFAGEEKQCYSVVIRLGFLLDSWQQTKEKNSFHPQLMAARVSAEKLFNHGTLNFLSCSRYFL